MQREHSLLDVGVLIEQPDSPQLRPPRGLRSLVVGELLVERAGQQSKPITQPDMVACEVAGCGRQVMSGDGGQAVFTPPLGVQRAAGTVAVEFEPQDRGAENSALTEVVPDPRLDGAEVLA